MGHSEVVRKLKQIRDMYRHADAPFEEDYEWGFYNGIEMALSMVEDRPAFYMNRNGSYNPDDLANYPEYFL